MAFKLCILAAIAAVAVCEYESSSHGHSAASYTQTGLSYGHSSSSYGHDTPAYEHHEPSYPDAQPSYKFAYQIHDTHTHDIKSQEEDNDGHHVKGYYSLVEPDGSKRIVHYADNGHGFEATVHKEAGHYAAPIHSYGHAVPTYKGESKKFFGFTL